MPSNRSRLSSADHRLHHQGNRLLGSSGRARDWVQEEERSCKSYCRLGGIRDRKSEGCRTDDHNHISAASVQSGSDAIRCSSTGGYQSLSTSATPRARMRALRDEGEPSNGAAQSHHHAQGHSSSERGWGARIPRMRCKLTSRYYANKETSANI